MIEINSLPLIIILSFSLWGLIIFIFQVLFFKIKNLDNSMYISGIYLLIITFINAFGVIKYFNDSPYSINAYYIVSLAGLVITMAYIYIHDNQIIFAHKSGKIRAFIYSALIITAVVAVYFTNIKLNNIIHYYFNIFLLGEIIYLFSNLKNIKIRKIEKVTSICVYVVIITMNTVDSFLIDINMYYGIGMISIIIPFYFILKYKELKDNIRDKIIVFNELQKKEKKAYVSALNLIINLLESKNQFLVGHSQKVSMYSKKIGKNLGLSNSNLEELETTALLHDIGYVGIDMDEYSNKLNITKKELHKIKKHPTIGADILKKSSIFSRYSESIKYHHEHWDGTGYPYGVSAKNIPLFSRIIFISDTYDSLTSNRFYRSALSKDDALMVIRSGKSKEFDPSLVDIFVEIIESEK